MKKYTFLLFFCLLVLGSKAQTARCGSGVNWDSMRVSNPEIYQEHQRIESHTQQFIAAQQIARHGTNFEGGGNPA